MPEQLHSVNSSHGRKWGNTSPCTGYDVEYHRFIGTNGQPVITRCDWERTGHTLNRSYNNGSISIVLAGDFSHKDPSHAQVSTLYAQLSALSQKYGIPKQNVIGHKETPNSPTSCPGDHLLRIVEEWKKR